jgi:hypothetical protein
MSNLVAFVNIPARICPRNHVVEGKFLLTREPGFDIDSLKIGLQLHVQEVKKSGRPFSDTRRKINMDILKEFAKKSGAGQVTIGEHKPSFQTVAPGTLLPASKKGGKTSEFVVPDAVPDKKGSLSFTASLPVLPSVAVAVSVGAAGVASSLLSSPPARPPPPAFVPPPLLLQSIETAIATAPSEMWSLFRDYEFLAEGLKFFRVPNPPPV